GKTCIFSHPVYLFLREFSLQDSRGGSLRLKRLGLSRTFRRLVVTLTRRYGVSLIHLDAGAECLPGFPTFDW
ncbi:hypothetical protein C9Z85_20315, partial [Escherichia coli]